jgi:predicted transcriptional regulator
MDITKILSTIKGKVLDATNYELLVSAYDLQQQNIIQLKENNTSIKESNTLLKEKLDAYEKLIKEQEEKISQFEVQALIPISTNSESRAKEDNDILIFLSNNSQSTIYKEHLSSHLNLQDAKTQYYLDGLLENKLVHASFSFSSPTSYSLTKHGRAYLVENDLL